MSANQGPSQPHYHDWIEGPDGYHSACAGCGKPYPKNEMPPLVLTVVESVEDAWVATWEELEDEARTVMGAFAKWLDGLPEGLLPSDIAAEVRVQIASSKGSDHA